MEVSQSHSLQRNVFFFFYFYLLNCLCCNKDEPHCWQKPLFCEKNFSPYVLYVPSCECSTTIKNPIFGSILCRRSLTGNLSQQLIRYCQSEVRKTCPALPDLDWHCSHESHERAVKEWGSVRGVCICMHKAILCLSRPFCCVWISIPDMCCPSAE